MLTATAPINDFVSETDRLSQNETAGREVSVSDTEVLRRVHQIRSGWTVAERVERRREASQRFADLLEALSVDQNAA